MGLIHIENKSGQHSMLSETILNKKMNDKMKILQISQNEIEIVSSIEETYVSKRLERWTTEYIKYIATMLGIKES